MPEDIDMHIYVNNVSANVVRIVMRLKTRLVKLFTIHACFMATG